jgi:RNA polymerase-binding transcription factor DksA
MKAELHAQAVFPYICAGTTQCVLCGKRIGAVRFKGRPVCKNCIEYAKTIS